MLPHPIQWRAPSPLWTETLQDPAAIKDFRRPAILRFANDAFMEEFLTVLEKDPVQLRGFLAQPDETWRKPAATPQGTAALLEPVAPLSGFARKLERLRRNTERARSLVARRGASNTATSGPASESPRLKLYQPAHQRYYLVTASLVCGITGLPDRALDSAHRERVSFVVRRLLPAGGPPPLNVDLPPFNAETWEEYAFITTPSGSSWLQIPQADVVLSGEEQLPLFPAGFRDDIAHKRRVFAGMVPVGKREAYMGAKLNADSTTATEEPIDTRKLLFVSQVLEPWKSLRKRAEDVRKLLEKSEETPPVGEAADLLKNVREQIQVVSWYVLLDFAKYLQQYLPRVWSILTSSTISPTEAETELVNALTDTKITKPLIDDLRADSRKVDPHAYVYPEANVLTSLRAALIAIKGGAPFNQDFEDRLEAVTAPYDRESTPEPESITAIAAWPPFLFPLADSVYYEPLPPPPDSSVTIEEEDRLELIDDLLDLIGGALPISSSESRPNPPLNTQLDTREGWFVIRCVFERDNCGPLMPALVSKPTEPFQMASFFDPDAPSRPIRIALPIDTTPAGLRKFDKNTAFMISDVLCGQMERMKGVTLGDLVRAVLPWPLHKDLSVPEKGPCQDKSNSPVGHMCSMSIPIITICALLLLMIIVSLLDVVFRWMPFFIQCFQLPGFKAKRKNA